MNSFQPRIALGFLILSIISCQSIAQENPQEWIYVKVRNFEIYSHLSEKKTVKLAKELKIYVDGIEQVMPILKRYTGGNFKILILKDAEEFSRYVPPEYNALDHISSIYQEREDYMVICIKGSLKNAKATESLYAILAKVILNNEGNYPRWFVDGMAQVFSTFDSARNDQIKFGVNRAFHKSWLRSNTFQIFAMRYHDVFDIERSPAEMDDDTLCMYTMKCYLLCHYFIFHSDKTMNPKFIEFAEKCKLEGSPETQLMDTFEITFQELEHTIRKYERMPYFMYNYEADLSGIDPKHPEFLDLQRTLFLGETNAKNYQAMGLRQTKLMENHPEDPITLEVTALYYDVLEDEEQFQSYMTQAVKAGCTNSYLHLHYASHLIDSYVRENGHQSLTRKQINKVSSYIAPSFKEKKINIWGTQLFLYAWTESQEEPPSSLDDLFTGLFHRYKNNSNILFNLASVYWRKKEKDHLVAVIEQLRTLNLAQEDLKNIEWYENQLEDLL